MKKILQGLGVSPGQARGKVRVIHGVQHEEKFQSGEILVAKITDPTMVMMMNQAGAIICDIGGMTSHPSIIARELGIPCVVNAKIATMTLKDGQEVIINGTTGEIFLAG